MTTRAVIYTRVSTDAQEREGTSLDTQERACFEYAEQQGWIVVERLRDTASGFNLERPGLSRVRQLAAGADVDVVLGYALDRLSRKQTHVAILVEEMEQLDVKLAFVTEEFEDTATGQLIRSVKAFAAELEREKIVERTSRGKLERARSGRLPQGTGRGMYGYIYNRETGKREVNDDQAIVVRRIFGEFDGGASIAGIADSLNADGIPTFAGKRWFPASVFHMLRNSAYAGRTVYRRTESVRVRGRRVRRERAERDWIEVEGATPAIIPESLFDDVQARLDDPERLRRGKRKWSYALSGRIRCRRCGRAMVGQTQQQRYRYYRCRSAYAGPKRERCESRYVRADGLEHAVRDAASRVLSNPQMVLAEAARVLDVAPTKRVDPRALTALTQRRERLLRLFELGEIDEAELTSRLRELDVEHDLLSAPFDPQIDRPPMEWSVAEVEAACEAVRDWVENAEGDDLQLLLDALAIRVEAGTDGTVLHGVIPSSAPLDEHADVRPVVTTG